jgi:hypothetical protein
VQEFVLKLLFREDFKQFVNDLGDLLGGYKNEML